MKKDSGLKDLGSRRSFAGGAVRDAEEGKGRYDLISPEAMRRLAIILEKGAKKYSSRNWEKGISLHSFFDSGIRHLYKWLDGWTDEDHLAMGLWNIHSLIHTEDKFIKGKFIDGQTEDLLKDLPTEKIESLLQKRKEYK